MVSENTCDRCPVEVANGHGYYVNGDRLCGECYEMNVTELGREHGEQYAVELWHADPPDYDMAREWWIADQAGTLTDDYPLPNDAGDAIHPDLRTEGWGWGHLADYQGAWENAYYTATTNLMVALLASYHDQREEEE